MKVIKWVYIVCYVAIAIFIICMQHHVWKLSAKKYLLVIIGYLLFALVVRIVLKKILNLKKE